MDNTIPEIEKLLDELITQQKQKVARIAAELRPNLGPDDLLNPHDFPELLRDARFNYEDGILAGLLAAQMAIRSWYRKKVSHNPHL